MTTGSTSTRPLFGPRQLPTHSFIAYQDEQGRYVREYPANGEVFEIGPDWQQLTLLSVNGVPVPGIGFQA